MTASGLIIQERSHSLKPATNQSGIDNFRDCVRELHGRAILREFESSREMKPTHGSFGGRLKALESIRRKRGETYPIGNDRFYFSPALRKSADQRDCWARTASLGPTGGYTASKLNCG